MALTPQTDEAFLREVDEELRRDQIGTIWRNYGRVLIVLLVAGLAAFGGYLWWQSRQEKAVGLASEQLTAALNGLSEGRGAASDVTFNKMAAEKNAGYRAAAKLALAAHMLQSGDTKGSAKAYAEIAADDALDQPVRDLATIRGTTIEFDTLTPQQVIARLKPLAIPGEAWFGSAGEMTALAWLKLNRTDQAGAMFMALTKDQQVPESIRARAVRISGALGTAPTAAAAPVPGKE